MSDSSDKIKKHFATAAMKARVLSGSGAKSVGKIRSAVPTERGVVMYIEVDSLVANEGSKAVGGISIEIPMYTILKEGQTRICPSLPGWYLVTLSDGKEIEAWYDTVKSQWSIAGVVVGQMHEIFVEGWPFPAIVVGIKKLGDVDPNMVDLVQRIGDSIEQKVEERTVAAEDKDERPPIENE